MRRPARVLVVVVAALSLLGAVAVAGGTSVSAGNRPAAWAKRVCNSVGSWLETIDEAAADTGASPPTTPTEGKQELVRLMRQARNATRKLVRQLNRADAPDVDGGQEVADIVGVQLRQVRSSITGAFRAVKRLPVDDPAGFIAEARAAQGSLESGMEGVQQALRLAIDLDAPELLEAFTEQDACQDLTGG